jgi:cell division protein FtsW
MTFSRTDTSLASRWWWTVDRWTLAAVALLVAIGAVLTLASSPPVAERIGLETFHFARRQFVFLALALTGMVAVSLLSGRGIQRLALIVFAVSLSLMAAVPFIGTEINGATRWFHIGTLSIQPSEFIKPSFAVVAAWILAESRVNGRVPGYPLATGLFLVVAALLLLQPDVGMAIVVGVIWGVQFFVSGVSLLFVGLIGAVLIGAAVMAYFTFGHVQVRVDRFLDPAAEGGYQVMRGLEAFRNGGLFGRGPGEGQIKSVLPDAHTDFIFAVAGEEFGLLLCLLIVALFAFVVLRGLSRVLNENEFFNVLAVTGLLALFGVQAIINMASAIHLMPPKGMTLPFISYGGSSVLALALTIGMVLALTRERPGQGGGV